MLRRKRSVFLFCLIAQVALGARLAPAATQAELDDRAQRAGKVFRELRTMPDREIPDDLIARSRCVAVIPNVIKAAWVLGGYYGRGVLACRNTSGEWSPPVHVLMTGGSFGLQFGASSTDVVLFFMSTRSVRSLLVNKIKLSGEAAVAAGPVGRGTEAATDARFTAEIYSYARSRGLFAGVSFAGGYLGVQQEDTRAYYGKSYTPSGVLFEHEVTSVPKSAWTFLSALPQPRPVAKGKPVKPAPAPKKSAAKKKAPSAPAPVAAEPPAATSTVLTPVPPVGPAGPLGSGPAGPGASPPPAAVTKTDVAPPSAPAPPAATAPTAPPIPAGPLTAPIEAPPPYGPAAPPAR